MADTNPVTRKDLLTAVSKSLQAQQRLREVMSQVAAETAAAKPSAPSAGTPK